MDIYNKNEVASQNIYDAFNSFIFSNDIKIFGKLMYKLHFFKQTQKLPGDIGHHCYDCSNDFNPGVIETSIFYFISGYFCRGLDRSVYRT